MLLSWMLYSALVAALLALAAVAVERALRWAGRPARGVWGAALAGSLGFAAAGWLRPRAAPLLATTGGPPAPAPEAFEAPASLAAALPAADALARLDGAALLLWAALSLLVALGALRAAWSLRRQRRRWTAERQEGRRVLVSDTLGPALVGLLRPQIVLPRWALALSEPSRRLILAHEEEHRRARDPLLLFCGFLAAAALPWSPALWWQLRRLRLAVEVDCDRRVLRRAPDPAAYGRLLLAVGARASGHPLLAPALTEPRSSLETRIRAMIAVKPAHHRARAAGLGLAALALVALACEAPRPTEPPAPGDGMVLDRVPAQGVDAGTASAEPRPVHAATGRITGVVTDAETGQPLAGVRVWVRYDDGRSRGSLTQDNGRYFIINVPPGTYEMGYRLEGHASVVKRNVQITAGVTRTVDTALPVQR